jgi:hypothetical protein
MWSVVFAECGVVLQYGHTISNAAIVVMPASSVVDTEVCAFTIFSFKISSLLNCHVPCQAIVTIQHVDKRRHTASMPACTCAGTVM